MSDREIKVASLVLVLLVIAGGILAAVAGWVR